MKILAFGDLIGRIDIVDRILKFNLSEFDFLVYTGDTPDPSVFKVLRESRLSKGIDSNTDIEKELIKDTIPYKALKKATKEVVSVCKTLEGISVPIFGVLGNADLQYYSQFVKWPFAELHNEIIKANGYNLIGYNGRPLYKFETSNDNENAFSEEKVKKDLDSLFKTVDPKKTILITHSPPYKILDKVEDKMKAYASRTYGEKAKEGNIGSIGIRNVVKKHQPFLHIFGHIHERRGVVKNNTTFINIGSTGEDEEVCVIAPNKNNVAVNFVHLPIDQ